MTDLEKKNVRRRMKEKTEGLTAAYRKAAGEDIRKQVLRTDAWRRAKTVMAFVSTEGEPDTREIIEAARREGKLVLLPRCVSRTEMEAVSFEGWENTGPGLYGIPEPTGPASEAEPEVILVPCVSATADGIRLGHGAGYYDRFLRGRPGLRVCLCFRELLAEELPADGRDERMDLVITDRPSIRREGCSRDE